MRALIIPEGFHQHGQPGGCAVQLAEVCQAGLAPFQLACQPLHIWQPCMDPPSKPVILEKYHVHAELHAIIGLCVG